MRRERRTVGTWIRDGQVIVLSISRREPSSIRRPDRSSGSRSECLPGSCSLAEMAATHLINCELSPASRKPMAVRSCRRSPKSGKRNEQAADAAEDVAAGGWRAGLAPVD